MLRILTLMAILLTGAAHAQDAKLDIELNSIGLRNDSCEVYLRVRNQTPVGYDVFKIDLAFFDRSVNHVSTAYTGSGQFAIKPACAGENSHRAQQAVNRSSERN